MKKILIFIILILSQSSFCNSTLKDSLAVQISKTEIDTTFTEKPPINDGIILKFSTNKEFWFGISILLTLIIVIPLLIWIVKTKNMSDDLTVKLLLTTIVIISTLFLVVAGFDDQSIAPAFGLFGAILGYVFGKSENKNQSS